MLKKIIMSIFGTCIGEEPLSTLSMPSFEAPPPRMAVRILKPIVMRLAQGEVEPESVSKLSLLFGPVNPLPPGLKIICIIIPEDFTNIHLKYGTNTMAAFGSAS